MKNILVIFRVPDMSNEQYNGVMSDLDRVGMYKVKTRSHHISASEGKGSVVVDVWDSPEALNEFFGTLAPILAKNGVTPPQPEVYPINNIIS